MKKFKKSLAVLTVTLVTATAMLTGCGGGSGSESEKQSGSNSEKTMLYVGNYDGGFGHVWLDHIIAGFEEKYKDVSFETGKKGVKIVPENNKDLIGPTLYTTISSKTNDVYFTESADYYSYLNNGYMLDITDVVTASQAEDGNKTIESKMSDIQKSYYKADDNKYYAIPHYSGFSGLMYDIDLFESEKLYYSGTNEGQFIKADQEERSAGPDGEKGTTDDGLPATYDEFFALLDYMVTVKNITPFVFTGQYPTYINWLITALFADYEGIDNLQAILNLDGSICDNIVKVTNGQIGSPESIALTEENANLIFGTQGKLEALKFVEKLLTNQDYYYTPCISGTYTQRNAQTDFLKSGIIGTGKRIAFLAEGTWWEEEANGDFSIIAKQKGDNYSRANRNIGLLPLPKASKAKVGENNTLIDINKSTMFIYSGISEAKKDLAKKFIAYACTDEALRDFTLTTSCPKALNYEMGSDYSKLDKYGKNIWSIYSESDYVLHYSSNNLYKNALSDMEVFKAGYLGVYGNQPSTVLTTVTAGSSAKTAEEVFKDIVTYHNAEWLNATLGMYINK